MRRLLPAPLTWFVVLGPVLAAAQDFRVETDVFVGKKKDPVAQYLTIFKSGMVYDFALIGAQEVTIYDVKRGRFILLDPDRRIKAEVSLDELRQLTANIKIAAGNAEDENVRFLADPVFEVQLNEQARTIQLKSKPLTYSATAITPPDPGYARRYADFADGYARLNGIRLGNLPPFARMQLNDHLAKQGWTPKEVTRVVPGQAVLAKDYEVRSRHLYTWRVLPTDDDRMASTDRIMQAFEEKDIAAYLKWPQKVANAQ